DLARNRLPGRRPVRAVGALLALGERRPRLHLSAGRPRRPAARRTDRPARWRLRAPLDPALQRAGRGPALRARRGRAPDRDRYRRGRPPLRRRADGRERAGAPPIAARPDQDLPHDGLARRRDRLLPEPRRPGPRPPPRAARRDARRLPTREARAARVALADP